MPNSSANTENFESAIAAIPTCALDDAGRREQRARYAQLAATATRLDRRPEAIVVEFAEHLDRETLERTLAVERECCPFFVFEFDEPGRRLRITVREAEQVPALEAMAAALAAAEPATSTGSP
jgi:hypothetical protein